MKPDELPEFSVGVTNEGLPFTAPKGVNGKADSMHPLARALHRSDSGGCDDWTIGRATVSRAQFVASASGKTKSMYVHNLLKFPSRVPLHPPTPSLALAEPPDSPSPQKPKPDVEMADTAAVEAEGHGKTAVEVPADDVSTGPAVPMQPSMPPSMGDIEAKFAEALAKQQLEFDRRFAEALAKQQEQQQQPLQSSPDQGAEAAAAAAAASAVASPAGQTAKQLADATAMQQQQQQPLQAPSATAAPSAELSPLQWHRQQASLRTRPISLQVPLQSHLPTPKHQELHRRRHRRREMLGTMLRLRPVLQPRLRPTPWLLAPLRRARDRDRQRLPR